MWASGAKGAPGGSEQELLSAQHWGCCSSAPRLFPPRLSVPFAAVGAQLLAVCPSPCSVSFCAEHARRNALALQAQLKKSNPGPASETLLCQLSSYARTELGSQSTESGRSEASRILGER